MDKLTALMTALKDESIRFTCTPTGIRPKSYSYGQGLFMGVTTANKGFYLGQEGVLVPTYFVFGEYDSIEACAKDVVTVLKVRLGIT